MILVLRYLIQSETEEVEISIGCVHTLFLVVKLQFVIVTQIEIILLSCSLVCNINIGFNLLSHMYS